MNIWEMFNETLLPDKKYFYCSLNIEDIADVDCKDAKDYGRALIKNLGE